MPTYTLYDVILCQAVEALANFPGLYGEPEGVEALMAYTRTKFLFDSISGQKMRVPEGFNHSTREEFRRLGRSLAEKAGRQHEYVAVEFSGTPGSFFQFTLRGESGMTEWIHISTSTSKNGRFNVLIDHADAKTVAFLLTIVVSYDVESIKGTRVASDHSHETRPLGIVLADLLQRVCKEE